MVYARWHGGSSYSQPYAEHTEQFPSLQAAKDALRERYDSNGHRPVTFHYVHQPEDTTLVPAVDRDSVLWLYGSAEPDRVAFAKLAFGPRGGVRMTTPTGVEHEPEALTSADCLDHRGNGCTGKVEYRTGLSATGRSFPRCDGAWAQRLEVQEGINRRYPQHQPADFDPSYAGECWDED